MSHSISMRFMMYYPMSWLNLSKYTMRMNSENFENSFHGFATKNWSRNMCNRYYFMKDYRGA